MFNIILQEKDFECTNWENLYEFLVNCKENNITVMSHVMPHSFRKYVQAKVYTRLEAIEIVDVESAGFGLFILSVNNYAPTGCGHFAIFKEN